MKRRIGVSIGAIVVVVLVGAGVFYWMSRTEESYRTLIASKADVVQEVAFSGSVEAVASVDVAFEVTGLVEELTVGVGDTVKKGDVLAKLDTRVARLESVQSTASRASGQDTARVTWENALNAQAKAEAEGIQTLEKRRQSVRNAKSELDQAKEIYLQTERESGDSSTTDTAYQAFLVKDSAYNAAQKVLTETTATIEKANKAAADAARLAESQYLATTQTGPSIAGLSALEASEAIKEVLLTKSTLLSPIDGVITHKAIEVGEIAVANTSLMTVQQTEVLKLTAQAPETDVLKISPGMRISVTYDALTPTTVHTGIIDTIAPAADVIEGVPTYEITAQFADSVPMSELRPGLSANITVHAAAVEDVVAVPRRVISHRDGQQFVRILTDDGTVSEREVSTGLIGSVGTVEITSGVSEGDEIVIGTNGD